MNFKESIENYNPYNEQEEKDKEIMLKYINTFDDVLTRNNEFAHFTASTFAVNKDRTKVLMIYHNIYKSWSWPGGHADGESDLMETAIREVKEETGVKNVKPIVNDIFSLEVLTVDGHIKRNKYVASHIHLNLTYLLEIDENEVLKMKEDENSGVKWVNLEDMTKVSTEKWIAENIYTKIEKKLGELLQKLHKKEQWYIMTKNTQKRRSLKDNQFQTI